MTRFEFGQWFALGRGAGSKNSLGAEAALDRLCIMGGNHPAGECNVCKILAISIEFWIRQIGRAGKRELLSAVGRMRGPAR